MSRRVSLLARVDQIVAKGDWSRERAQQRQAHHVHTRTSDKRGKRLLGTQATIEYYSHQLKKQDKAPKTPQNAEDARRLDDAQVVRRKAGSAFATGCSTLASERRHASASPAADRSLPSS